MYTYISIENIVSRTLGKGQSSAIYSTARIGISDIGEFRYLGVRMCVCVLIWEVSRGFIVG